jgi:hypothetical protein
MCGELGHTEPLAREELKGNLIECIRILSMD